MTDYNPPDDTEIATSKAIKATTGRRLRDMSIAIAEGNPDAPRVEGLALGGVYAGSQSVSDSDWATFVDLDNIKAFTVIFTCVNGSATIADFDMQTSTDGGSTWSSSKKILDIGGSATVSDRVFIDLDSGDQFSFTEGFEPSNHSYDSGIDAVRFNMQYGGSSLDIGLIINEAFDPA